MERECGFQLICLVCGEKIESVDQARYICGSCKHEYPVKLGIVDIRRPERMKPTAKADQIAQELIAKYRDSSLVELLDVFYRESNLDALPQQLQERFKRYRFHQVERGCRFVSMFFSTMRECSWNVAGNYAVEIGCGSGAGLLTLARHFQCVIGIDPDLPSLILARKALDETGIDNVLLLRGYAQEIPVSSGSIDAVIAQNALEHLFEIGTVTAEIYRVLRPGGAFFGDSRNRFDLFFPEPHTGIRWVGLLPRRWAKAYVRWRTGTEYDHTYLLSYWDLRKAVRTCFREGNYRIVLPDITVYGQSARVNYLLKCFARIPMLSGIVLWTVPVHLAAASKPQARQLRAGVS